MILFFMGFSVAFNIALICYAWSLFKRVRSMVRKSTNRVVYKSYAKDYKDYAKEYKNYAKDVLLDKKDINEAEHDEGHYSKILKYDTGTDTGIDTGIDTDKLCIRENGEALTIPDMHN